ncbi:hypothetical protein [Chachezhania antarctica]|uniref:hypothetical protein n=1 Tax=Chachezhania antarctica TaxID=2340860 RepID=UPI000EAF159D|nr:hypothetical protein [Chachezhania antarctica]|tara:strand:- start:11007 stop:11378 length:372 start_codon:yes stop_codon:yes gene_type:complete
MNSQLEIARAAWGPEIPDWVVTLARECAQASQNKVAAQLGYSAALVSQVLRRKYPGDLRAVETAVRGAYEEFVIACPALGEIAPKLCQEWRGKARKYSNENSQRVRMFRACNACPHFRKEQVK